MIVLIVSGVGVSVSLRMFFIFYVADQVWNKTDKKAK